MKKVTEKQMSDELKAAGWRKTKGYILRDDEYPEDGTSFWFYPFNPLQRGYVWSHPSGEIIEENIEDAYEWHKENN